MDFNILSVAQERERERKRGRERGGGKERGRERGRERERDQLYQNVQMRISCVVMHINNYILFTVLAIVYYIAIL